MRSPGLREVTSVQSWDVNPAGAPPGPSVLPQWTVGQGVGHGGAVEVLPTERLCPGYSENQQTIARGLLAPRAGIPSCSFWLQVPLILFSPAQCPVPWAARDRERVECHTPRPVLERQAGQRVPGETALPPLRLHTHACTPLRRDGSPASFCPVCLPHRSAPRSAKS